MSPSMRDGKSACPASFFKTGSVIPDGIHLCIRGDACGQPAATVARPRRLCEHAVPRREAEAHGKGKGIAAGRRGRKREREWEREWERGRERGRKCGQQRRRERGRERERGNENENTNEK